MIQRLIDLNTRDYEHPFDRMALEKVNAIPIVPNIVNFMMNWTVIKWKIVSLCGSNFHVTNDSCPDLYVLAKDIAETLDIRLPELYFEQEYSVYAYTTGNKDNAFIVLTTGSVDKLSDDELRFVIGHECGHFKSGHVLYHLMTAFLSDILTTIPGASAVGMPLNTALAYWNRMSEFTADRAGLLACQDLNIALSAIMKMSGLPERYYKNASVDGFMKQAKEFDEQYGGTTDQIIKTVSIISEDHPWTIVRAAELIRWVESGEYDRILGKTKGKRCHNCGHNNSIDAKSCVICGSTRFEI